jgi:hypothetical protein
MHYYLVCLTILIVHAPEEQHAQLQATIEYSGYQELPNTALLNSIALDICGIAFTARNPSVVVNAFGPISYCKSNASSSLGVAG